MPCRMPIVAKRSRAPYIALPLAILLGFVTSCGGNDDTNANQIRPIQAGIRINPPTDDPVVWLDPVGASNDLVTIDVKLRTSSPLEFHGFTLFFRFDPTLVQFAGAMQPINPLDPEGAIVDPFGQCGSNNTYCGKYPFVDGSCNNGVCVTGRVTGTACLTDANCEPGTSGPSLCQLASMALGEVPLSLFGNPNGQCNSYIVSGGGLTDVLLLRVAFVVTTALGRDAQGVPIGTRLELISYDQTGMSGDCGILDANQDYLAIPCDDGMAELTGVQ